MKNLIIITVLLATGPFASAQIISTDTFDVPVGTAFEFDLQANQAARQLGSTINISYSAEGAALNGANQEYLSQTEAFDGSGVLVLRALCNGDGSASIAAPSVAINEDLAPLLAEKRYTISYTGIMIDRMNNVSDNPLSLESWYQGIFLGGAGLPPELTSVSTDLGFGMRSDGIAQIWGDGNLLSSIVVTNYAVTEPYTLTMDIDETNGTANASVEVGGIVTDLPGPFPVNFESGETARRIQLMNRIYVYGSHPPNPSWDAWVDAQINNFQIMEVSGTGTGGPFGLSNEYYRVSGSDGLVTEISLDQSGTGNYDDNTIKSGSYCAFTVDGTLLQSSTAAYSMGDNTLTISGLPSESALVIDLEGNVMTWTLGYTGTHDIQHEWIFDFRASGFYNRANGTNVSPAVYVDMPFESFYSEVGQHKSFWPVEAFKSFSTYGPQGSLGPVLCRARADRDDSVFMDASALDITQGQAESESLRLITGPQSKASGVTISFEVRPKSYGATVDGSPLPEFYVEPDIPVSPLSDPSTTYSASDLLTEFYQHTLFWWGSNGSIWSDWVMRSCGMMDGDSWYVQHVRNSLSSWLIATDGTSTPNNYGYAFTWGGRRGWPFDIYDHLDNRHFNNNAIYITALWRYIIWTGDTNFLNIGSTDMDIRIGYVDSTYETPSLGAFPYQMPYDDTNNYDEYIPFGQTFTATKPFTKLAIHTPTWGAAGSGLTLTLYQGEGSGGTQLAQDTFSNVVNNGWPELTVTEQPAGTYYVEMTNPVGTIGWWGHENALDEDVNPTGEGYFGGGPRGDMITRARALMNYQQTKLGGATHHLITLGPDVSGHHQGRGYYRTGGVVDVQGNWYDMLPFGYQDLFANINYYESLRAMADLEELAGNMVKANEYRVQMPLTRAAFSNALYRSGLDAGSGTSASRFIACKDVDGVDHDYGYAGLNCWAVVAGLASQQQAGAIYGWLDGGKSLDWYGTWNSDIYDKFKFGPRGSTIYNNTNHGSDSWWRWETANWDVIQNGGASIHESGFDIEARAKFLGGDNAWNRMSTILSRYADPDRMCMSDGYYGEVAQGGRPDGSWSYGTVGWMYAEFPETCLAGAAFFNGFFGIEPSTRGLRFEPVVPTGQGVTTIGARNIHFYGARFDIAATTDSITFTCTSNPDGRTFYMTGGYSGTGTFSRTVPLDQGAAILSHRPQAGIEELSLAFSSSSNTSYVVATFDGTALGQHVLQLTGNLASNDWNAISLPFSSNTSIVVEATSTHEFYRAVGDD